MTSTKMPDDVMERICSITNCGREHMARGYCRHHYNSWLKYGDPLRMTIKINKCLSFIKNIALPYKENDCLIWPFHKNKNRGGRGEGYAMLWHNGKNKRACRLICEMVYGAPPEKEYDAAHSCGKGDYGCVNPKHLRWATKSENQNDQILHGTRIYGEKHPLSKLTEKDVIEIRQLREHLYQSQIAKIFGIGERHVGMIQRKQKWSWVNETSNERP